MVIFGKFYINVVVFIIVYIVFWIIVVLVFFNFIWFVIVLEEFLVVFDLELFL